MKLPRNQYHQNNKKTQFFLLGVDSKSYVISRRVFIILLGQLLLSLIVLGRVFYLQIIRGKEYTQLSEKNRLGILLIFPPRGVIYDKNNKEIAQSLSCFKLSIIKDNIQKQIQVIEYISNLLHIPSDSRKNLLRRFRSAKKNETVTLIEQMSEEAIIVVEERSFQLQDLVIDASFYRHYPYDWACAHLLGYIGYIAPAELEQNAHRFGAKNLLVGKVGLEKQYNEVLTGVCGYKRVEVNANGRVIKELFTQAPSYGDPLHLSLDVNLQLKAYEYLDQHSGVLMAMHCKTGKMLVCASKPSFDPNRINQNDRLYWRTLMHDPARPLLNRAISGLYPPGSIFKIITVLAALEHGIDPGYLVHCANSDSSIKAFRCHNKNGHGTMNMLGGLKFSCNNYMYQIAKIVGADRIIEVAQKLGIGSLTHVDLAGEMRGLCPSPQWKREKMHSRWTIGDTLNLSIGQGFVSVTPIQILNLIATIANEGMAVQPTFNRDSAAVQRNVKINVEYLKFIKLALYETVNAFGTAHASRLGISNFFLCGKTGTAQVRAKRGRDEDLNKTSIIAHKNHAWFAGFASYPESEYALCSLIEHGGGGAMVAAPITSRILKDIYVYLYPKSR
ncbi:Penicillin binding protein 2 [Rickettsiales endosymbiont of Paramecium tredecaurelia]|uniref:penicillin-binding protein 2 n=1 Tax=Candidatus Sarmatiella mevalonica TaxID=2770581 RepID=UPI0019240B60|nr:penicillin-binding protein 2 [Candidatus Sarmatiella mevalonica]MBL3284818.1 Penicillin binding protein 2 [Candidatus Sarmatiella mevalonica]